MVPAEPPPPLPLANLKAAAGPNSAAVAEGVAPPDCRDRGRDMAESPKAEGGRERVELGPVVLGPEEEWREGGGLEPSEGVVAAL